MVPLKAADRNIEVMGPYLERAAATGRSQVAAIGVAQETQRVFISRKRATDPGKCPQFSFDKKDRRVTVYYFYLWDAGFGPAFIKMCTYCPWPMKIWVNGHEWAKQQCRKAGLGFTELSNGFAACDDPAVLQKICDALQPGTINVFFQRWLSRLPLPLGAADQQAGYWWELSMAQVEVSRTLVFTQPRHARAFFEALVTDNLDLGRPDTIEIIFGRRIVSGRQRATRGTFKTKVVTRGVDVTINAFYRHSRIKQYLKDGRALRIETVINSPTGLRIGRRIACLGELQDAARAINTRLLDTERAGQGCVLANPLFERIAHPTVDAAGRRATAMRFGDSRVQALASALCVTLPAVTGITNRSLRALMTGLLGRPYTMTQSSYDLARIASGQSCARRMVTGIWRSAAPAGSTTKRERTACASGPRSRSASSAGTSTSWSVWPGSGVMAMPWPPGRAGPWAAAPITRPSASVSRSIRVLSGMNIPFSGKPCGQVFPPPWMLNDVPELPQLVTVTA